MHAAGEREIADSIDVDGPVIDGEVTRIADPLSTRGACVAEVCRRCDCAGDLFNNCLQRMRHACAGMLWRCEPYSRMRCGHFERAHCLSKYFVCIRA